MTNEEGANFLLSDPEYADFYYSIQPLNPRLPKPQVKPINSSLLAEKRIAEKISYEEANEIQKMKNLDAEFKASVKFSIFCLSSFFSDSMYLS